MAIDSELTLPDQMRGLDPRQVRGGGMERLEAHHRCGDTLDEAVILYEDIVGMFNLQDLDGEAAASI